MTNPTTHGQVPEALPAIQRFEVVDCIDSKHVPAVIPKPHGPWVRYEDHIAALAGGQATAAQPAPAWADQAVIEYRYTGGTHWCPLGSAERMRPDFDGVYRLQAGVYPVEQVATKASPASQGDAPCVLDVPDQCPYFGPSPHRDVWLDGWYAALRQVRAAQGDALDAERLDWLTFNLSGKALRDIGVVWSEHGDARRAIDAARAARKQGANHD